MLLARDLDPATLEDELADLEPFRRRQVCDAIYRRGIRSFDDATDLSRGLRATLAERIALRAAEVVDESAATDGTRKLLLELRDRARMEIVLIPEGKRRTICVSTQVGCPIACVFCASGIGGLDRNLSTGEIVEQFLIAAEICGDETLTNLVVMGMGEPMLNLSSLEPALRQICSTEGFGFSARRVTISTAGYPDRIRELAARGRPYNLAVSLHAADPVLRAELVPGLRTSPAELVAAARDWHARTGREPTFEVVLLAERNDGSEEAQALADLLAGTPCSVNLIPWNPVAELAGVCASPTRKRIEAFAATLRRRGINVTQRKRKGIERDAACGQLRLRSEA